MTVKPHPNDHLFDTLNTDERGAYTVNRATTKTIEPIKALFPSTDVNEMNVVLFSTNGTHGTATTIEEFEEAFKILRGDSVGTQITVDDIEEADSVVENGITYLIVQPRIVKTFYGVCIPSSLDEIEYLKKLRDSSKAVLSRIG